MTSAHYLLVILVVGCATFSIRVSFFLLAGRLELPKTIQDGLQYIPAAVLTALILPALARADGRLLLSWQNPRLVAGLVAIGVAYKTRNVLLTLGVGMLVLWIFQFWLG